MAKVLFLSEDRQSKLHEIDTGKAIEYINHEQATILDPYGKLTGELTTRGMTAIADIETDKDECDRLLGLPDYVPPPQTYPDWQGFQNALDEPEVGGNGLFAVFLGINSIVAWQAYNLVLDYIRGLAGNTELRTLNFLYQQLSQQLTEDQLNALNSAIAGHNIPILL